jgi:hypothetical protein
MKKIGFTLLWLVLVSQITSAQNTFQKAIVGPKEDKANYVVQTSDEGYAIVGTTRSGISGSLSDVLFTKTDVNGNTVWSKAYGSTGNEYGNCVQQTSDGGFIIAGEYDDLPNGRGFLIKTNAMGDTLWTKVYGSSYNGFRSVRQTIDGGYILSGYGSTAITRVDANGSVLWSKEVNSNLVYEIQQTTDGNFMGLTSFSGACLIKLNSAGDTIWAKKYSVPGNSAANSFQQTSDGGYIISGQVNATANYPEDDRAFVIKTNSLGNIEWQKNYGNATIPFYGFNIRQTNDGGYIAVLLEEINTGFNRTRLCIMKLNSAGTSQWCKRYEPTGFTTLESSKSVQQTSDGGFICAGLSMSFLADDSTDIYLIKTDPNGLSGCNETTLLPAVANSAYSASSATITLTSMVTTISIPTTYVNTISLTDDISCFSAGVGNSPPTNVLVGHIFPNPAKDFATISIENGNQEAMTVKVYSALGETLRSENLVEAKMRINLADFVDGLYFVELKSGEWVTTQKLLIQR